MELVELRVKLGGPSSKAKYSITTDSEAVARANDEKNPFKGSEKYLKPITYKWSKPYGSRSRDQRVTACLLHNEPASYDIRPG